MQLHSIENYLSYLMGATNIHNDALENLNIQIIETKPSGSRKLKIPSNMTEKYMRLIEQFLDNGFWNEIVGSTEIVFGFKHKDGSFEKIVLKTDTENHISELCTQFNKDPIEKTSNVYKYLAENDFYKQLIMDNYGNLVQR